MPAQPASVYRRRRLLVAVLALAVVTALALLGAALFRPDASTDRPPAAGPTTPAPVLPSDGAPGPVLPQDVGGEPVPDPAALAAVLAAELGDPRFGGPLSGRIVDPASGDELFAQDPTRAVVPASTLKLATALAVELTVPPERRLTTRVVAGAEPGQVVLVGGGDVTLSSAPAGNGYAGAATVAALAAEVRAAVPGPITTVVLDLGYYSGPETAPGWGSGDAPSSYAAPITAVMVDGGRFGPFDEGPRSGLPAREAGLALAAALGVDATVTGGTAPAGADVLGEVESAPIGRLVEQMLSASDNVLAEVLAREVAVAVGAEPSFDGAAAAVRDVLSEAGLPMDGVQVTDGSGLSPRNRLTTEFLTELLSRAAGQPATAGRSLLAGLPVASYDGTLAERFDSGAGVGTVRAKTGTLDGTSALAGVVETADGRLLVFAFVADAVPPGGRYPAEAALDELATLLAACGCRL